MPRTSNLLDFLHILLPEEEREDIQLLSPIRMQPLPDPITRYGAEITGSRMVVWVEDPLIIQQEKYLWVSVEVQATWIMAMAVSGKEVVALFIL